MLDCARCAVLFQHQRVEQLVVICGVGIGHEDRRDAARGEFGNARAARAREGQVGHAVGQAHLVEEIENRGDQALRGVGTPHTLGIAGACEMDELSVEAGQMGQGLDHEVVDRARPLAAAHDQKRGAPRREAEAGGRLLAREPADAAAGGVTGVADFSGASHIARGLGPLRSQLVGQPHQKPIHPAREDVLLEEARRVFQNTYIAQDLEKYYVVVE